MLGDGWQVGYQRWYGLCVLSTKAKAEQVPDYAYKVLIPYWQQLDACLMISVHTNRDNDREQLDQHLIRVSMSTTSRQLGYHYSI